MPHKFTVYFTLQTEILPYLSWYKNEMLQNSTNKKGKYNCGTYYLYRLCGLVFRCRRWLHKVSKWTTGSGNNNKFVFQFSDKDKVALEKYPTGHRLATYLIMLWEDTTSYNGVTALFVPLPTSTWIRALIYYYPPFAFFKVCSTYC